ncbi:MAG: hypothetical protein IKX43_07195 [Paludibacteraceae bacterium]|nr:hypothetical protein [Paludibacteraceae bacterium]
MKRIFTIVTMTMLWFVSLSAQVPQRLTYQAVIRDAIGNVITNQDLAVQVSILQGSIEGPVVYSENHTTSTTVNGVITLEVGGGMTSYDFTAIDWSNGPFYIRSTAELNGKSISVTSQLLSVPYSLYAHRAFLADKVNEQFLEDIIAAKIQSALEEQNVAWEDKIQKALDERDAIWQGKFEALEAVLDSITAQTSASPVDTVPSDTTIVPVDTTHVDTAAVDTVFKSAAIHGVLPGKFSMGKDLKVHFSKGMLQYLAYKDVWRFAKTQYDVVNKSYMDYWMYPAKGWADKFESSAGSVDQPECMYDYYDYIDYGGISISKSPQANKRQIHNGGNKANLWWEPSAQEWRYLFTGRNNADSLYSKGVVNDVKGYIILPDNWATPADMKFSPKAEDYTVNVYDKKSWEKMEAAGAVFMSCGGYWSWGGMDFTYLLLSEDHQYPIGGDENWSENDFIIEMGSCRYDNSFRLVTSDSTATVIMNGEAIENEDFDGEDNVTPNDYLSVTQPDLSNVDMSAGLLRGKFSVSKTKQVNFSQGNLQYNINTKVWKFADNQYDHITPMGWKLSALSLHNGWMDAFCWGSSGYAYEPSQTFRIGHFFDQVKEMAGTKYDWGVYNAISNGGNTPNIWRTLTSEEWQYLIKRYKDGHSLAFPGKVNENEGFILLPDDWDFDNGITISEYLDDATVNYSINIISKELWTRMESLGAVFLPSAGLVDHYRFFDELDLGHTFWADGFYWSSTVNEENDQYIWGMKIEAHSVEEYEDMNKYIYDISPKLDNVRRKAGCSVRLVRDVTE